MTEKMTIQQARQMIEYNSQKIQMIQEEIERIGYDIKLLQMQVRGMKNGKTEQTENIYYDI